MEKTIEIMWDGKPETVTIKRLNYKERLDLRKRTRKITIVGGRQNFEIDEDKLATEYFKLAIVKAPFELTDKAIFELDGALAGMIEEEIDAFNRLDIEKKSSC